MRLQYKPKKRRPYQCEECGRRFRNIESVGQHRQEDTVVTSVADGIATSARFVNIERFTPESLHVESVGKSLTVWQI
ncbi:hypothetical protein FJT64_004025 [Amphibalanus amphitrite]|uniref:C2H2-type domain-containing protein n=1 Tax=Amphibalanus amphitrite TaxID=1232801 RepID=A0A6A4VWS7_AMPAM|nr:hypothetical protein FJT64_004025 [Amphibalanus amphitrite]